MPIPAAAGAGALLGLPKLTAAGSGLLKTSLGLGIGSAIGIPWLSDSLTRGAIDKYKEALRDGKEATLERTNLQGNVEMDVNPFVGLFVEEDKIDDRAKKELTREIFANYPEVQKRAAALGIPENEIGYNASNFMAKTEKDYREKQAIEKYTNRLLAKPGGATYLSRAGENPSSKDILRAEAQLELDPTIPGTIAYNQAKTEQNQGKIYGLEKEKLGLQKTTQSDTRSLAEMGIIQSLIQNQQARIDNQENRNLQLQLRQFDREDRRQDRLDRLDENRRKEKLAIIQMLMRGLEGTARGFTGY